MATKKSILIPAPTESDRVGYFSKFDKRGSDECWIWTGTVTPNGYGRFAIGPAKQRQDVYAHRIAYFLEHGVDPGVSLVCHRCDVRLCQNPAHLFLGTSADNVHDAVSKGRMQQGERNGSARLHESDVIAIRTLHASGSAGHGKIAKKFGVSKTMIRSIIRRENWKHI